MFRRKKRIMLSFCILVSMLLTGIHADQNIISACAYTDSLAPSIDYRTHYATHHDIATAELPRREPDSYRIEAKKDSSLCRTGCQNAALWQTWIPVFSDDDVISEICIHPYTVSSTDTIIRYIHDQDGEKDGFLQI